MQIHEVLVARLLIQQDQDHGLRRSWGRPLLTLFCLSRRQRCKPQRPWPRLLGVEVVSQLKLPTGRQSAQEFISSRLSIWKCWLCLSGHVTGNATGDVAVDQYHRYEEDIQILKDLNVDAYRFSISWPRILPVGRGHINWAGVAYYNRFINELIRQGIEPYVSLYHWDLPLALEATGGWLDPDTVSAYTEFATLCFDMFGDRVKHWMTFNEPHIFATNGYQSGIDAPGRCSAPFGNCPSGDSRSEPLTVVHNVLNAHALAVSIYRKEFQSRQKGFIGLVIDGVWFKPCMMTQEDQDAAQRANEFWNACYDCSSHMDIETVDLQY